MGSMVSCALTPSHTVRCWGYGGINVPVPFSGQFATIESDNWWGMTFCGIRLDGTLQCVMNNSGVYVPAYAPSGTYTDVAGQGDAFCAVSSSGDAVCWGEYANMISNATYGPAIAPPGKFKSIMTTNEYSCGLHTDNTITCWGGTNVPTPASLNAVFAGKTYSSITTGGEYHSPICALTTAGKAICSGTIGWPIANASFTNSDTFLFIDHGCGLRTDGTMVCPGFTAAGGKIESLNGPAGISSNGQIVNVPTYGNGTPSNNSGFGCK